MAVCTTFRGRTAESTPLTVRHRSVEVTLDDPDATTEVSFPAPVVPLIPVPHLDTNDNETATPPEIPAADTETPS
ncbi:hypothetical protein BRD06_11565 [Halobacteriales archaeon QS_9_67_15]|nr:MAG: hypothetical protein BRD06_11565 [Halobacteriales archaeon QS_9_67_15]